MENGNFNLKPIRKIFESPYPLFLDLDKYLDNIATSFAKAISSSPCEAVPRGAVAYSVFKPTTGDFSDGHWHGHSPICFWPYDTDEDIARACIGGCLYFRIFQDIRPFTELWSSDIFRKSTVIEMDFVEKGKKPGGSIKDEEYLQRICLSFPIEVKEAIRDLFNVYKHNFKIANLTKKRKFTYKKVRFLRFNFPDLRHLGTEVNSTTETLRDKEKRLRKTVKDFAFSDTTRKIRDKLNIKTNEEFTELLIAFLKLFLAGDRPPSFVRVVGYKDFEYGKNKSNRGALVGILRSFDSVNSKKISELYKHVSGLLRMASYRVMVHSLSELWQRESLFRAASAIMSRNMSHNIGSHVLPKAEIASVREKLTMVYSKMRNGGEKITPVLADIDGMIEEIKTRLDRYIQYKSDFLAEITTEPLYSTRNALFFKDVMSTFLGNTLLIDNIAAMEGLGYEEQWCEDWENWKDEKTGKNGAQEYPLSSLRIRCFRYDTSSPDHEYKCVFQKIDDETKYSYDNVFVPFGWRDINARNDDLISVGLSEKCQEDLEIALPGPIGEFALYGFLENVIRNAAKHNKEAIQECRENDPRFALEIHLVIKEDPDDPDNYFRLSIYDNISDPNSIGNDGKTALYRKLQQALEMGLVDDTGRPRREAWGLAEMMICANLLAGNKSFKYEKKNISVEPEPVLMGEGDGTNRLVYRLRLMKPKKAALIGKSLLDQISEQKKDALKKDGIRCFDSLKTFVAESKKATSTIAAFDFALIGKDEADSLKRYRHLLPFRILRIDPDLAGKPIEVTDQGDLRMAENTLLDLNTSSGNFMHRLWQVWLQHRWNQSKPINEDPCVGIDIYLGQSEDTYPTNFWKEKLEGFPSPFPVRLWGKKDKGKVGTIAGDTDEGSAVRVFFDRHGEILDGLHSELSEQDAYIMIDKLNSDFSKVFQPPLSEPWVFPYQLIEAGLLRVLILDERVAERAVKTVSDTDVNKIASDLVGGKKDYMPSYWHVAWRSQVLIATHLLITPEDVTSDDHVKKPFLKGALHARSFKNQHKHYSSDSNDQEKYMKSICPELRLEVSDENINLVMDPIGRNSGNETVKSKKLKEYGIDVVLLHQGIIDNLPASWRENNKFINKLREFIPWIIVESGRGIPPEVQQSDEKFLPFSVIDHWLEGKRIGKLSLAQTLMTLTRNKE